MDDQRVIDTLDAQLPRWQGPQLNLPGSVEIPGSGWWGDYGQTSSMSKVIGIIDAYDGKILNVPLNANIPYLSFSQPIAYGAVRSNALASRYRSLRELDMDMSRLFEKARRYHTGKDYGRVLVLQRLYNALTAPFPFEPLGIPQSPTLFASLPSGPGSLSSMTTYRVSSKDRIFTSEARYKGMAFRLGDFVHLINPDDATRPIIGQIFKTFIPTKGHRTHHITVCWYYRPEETVHTEDRMFYENEVFKTSHFCDHPIEDVIERISVQFYVKWIRGRSKAPEYYPGWPVYVCHSRYNDRLWSFVRIKNWGSCIPDELRQTDFMAVVPFERQVEPRMVKSPFLRGITGPGFFGEPKGEEDDEGVVTSMIPGNASTPPGAPGTMPSQPSGYTTSYTTLTTPAPAVAKTTGITPGTRPPIQRPMTGWTGPRSVVTVLGGPQVTEQVSIRETLPNETARLFERDPRGQVLWFSGPPIIGKNEERAVHSLKYLEHVAKKRRVSDTKL